MSELKNIRRLNGCWLGLSKCFLIPQRVILSVMCFIALMNSSLISSSTATILKHVIVLVDLKHRPGSNYSQLCTEQAYGNPPKEIKFNIAYWHLDRFEMIVVSRYWSVTATNLPGAILAVLTGGKHVLGICVFIDGVVTLLTPIFLIKFDWIGILVLQTVTNLAQGAIIPTVFVLICHWIPRGERSLICSFIFFGIPVGSTLGTVITTKLIQYSGTWDTPFYIIGTAPLLWCILWQLLCYSFPDTHPFIKDKEFYYLHDNTASRRLGFKDIPWRGILTNLPVWAYFVGDAGHDWIIHTMYYQVPKYMHAVLKYQHSSFIYFLPWILLGCSAIISGGVADYIIGNNIFGVTTIRKFYTGLAGAGVIISLISVPFCGCSRLCNMIMFCIIMGSVGFFYPSICINSLDLSPNFAGILHGVMYVLSILSEWFISLFTSPFPKRQNFDDWRSFFWLVLLVQVITGLMFVIWCSGDVQNFDKEDYSYVGLGRKAVAEIHPQLNKK